MDVTEASLRERYSQMDTDQLIEMAAAGTLTDMASAVIEEVLAERGVKEEDKSKIISELDNEWKKASEITNALAPLGGRIVAQVIDSVVAFLILFLPVMLFKGRSESLVLVVMLAYFTYLLLQDALPNGQSIGKRVMKLSVINIKTGQPCSLFASFVRNIFLWFLGIIDLLFVTSRYRQRLGDKVANTVVVKVGKTLVPEKVILANTAPKRFPW